MKLFFNILFFCIFVTKYSFSETLSTKFSIKTKGLKIGEITWDLEILEKKYRTKIYLKDKGLLSSLYKFEGSYESEGVTLNNTYITKQYKQSWKTRKKKRDVKIIFNNKKIVSLKIIPAEKEMARIKYKDIQGYVDPLASFLNILADNKNSKTIDGRRIYILESSYGDGFKKILIKKYSNIWADHKRNDLQFLEIYQNPGSFLPIKINIGFKDSVFLLNRI